MAAGGATAKVARALRICESVSTQVNCAPLQSPPQPLNTWPAAGIAESVTAVPALYGSLQSAPQSIPAGLEVMRPFPVTLVVSANWLPAAIGVKVAVTLLRLLTVTTQADAPVQAPLQPAKLWPAAGVGVSVTCVPAK